jgi:hypothetical protein
LGSSFAGLLFLFHSISILLFLLAICSFILLDIVREKSVLRFSLPLKVLRLMKARSFRSDRSFQVLLSCIASLEA